MNQTLRGRSLSDTKVSSRCTRSLALHEQYQPGLPHRSSSSNASSSTKCGHVSAISTFRFSTAPALGPTTTENSTSPPVTDVHSNGELESRSNLSSPRVNITELSSPSKPATAPRCGNYSADGPSLASEFEASSPKSCTGYSGQALQQPTGSRESAVVSTEESLLKVLNLLERRGGRLPPIFMDFKGQQLGRHGSLCLITIHLYPENFIWIIDISVLGSAAFSTHGAEEISLKSVLESTTIIKGIFDSRSPSDALYNIYDVQLDGVHELQLMEYVSRHPSGPFLNGLVQCVERDINWSQDRRAIWLSLKHKGRKVFNLAYGGDEVVLRARPLSDDVICACVQDVTCLPDLWQIYHRRTVLEDELKVTAATKERIRLTQARNYQGQGQHMKVGPWNCVRQTWRKSSFSCPRSRVSRLQAHRSNYSRPRDQGDERNTCL